MIKRVNWQDVSARIKASNPKFHQIVEQLPDFDQLYFYSVSYCYGNNIIDKGVLQIPDENGHTHPVSTMNTQQQAIIDDINYCLTPLSMVIDKTVEVFLEADQQSIPLKFFSAGDLFGIFEYVSLLNGNRPEAYWSASAGARNIFFLPKVTDKLGYNRLKFKYKLKSPAPKSLYDQFSIFQHLAQTAREQPHWYNEILIFPKVWVEKSIHDRRWTPFVQYITKLGWSQVQYAREYYAYDLILQSTSAAVHQRRMKIDPYLLHTIKHVYSIAMGAYPGFKVAEANDEAGPLAMFKELFINVYGLKKYLPTMFHVQHFKDMQKLNSCYYSLSYPTFMKYDIALKNQRVIISDLRNLKLIQEYIKATSLKFNNPFNRKISYIELEFFHSSQDTYGEIKNSNDLFDIDPQFRIDLAQYPGRKFCATGPFLSGCIKIKNSYLNGR